ncbi:MAG: NADPH-dependent FMN reductase [Microbacterium sp.]|uniref:NADPH-dependent FMN reductase n=1 Tax=unclassified Microbacterium TaxID=2609290 RepID=UPI000C3AD5B0|nr:MULTISPECIES: NAD(P)H-dependent oxidoreductase [unclassified Microbacterium]MAY51306.1 NADPH-dependent FMN reductase [Microbacterium sp.]HBS74997.1 NADPH-dependent FMN reductase [Microbacterium sp.]|tara:strand:- start:7775 stop:8314 length:540 start_codon:yes stop_codon:yes gene_type:complete
MSLKVMVVVGNPKPASRTRKVAELLVSHLLSPGSYELEVIDLADHVDEIFAWPSEKMSALNTQVAESDLVAFASPTYKATYTGLLKAFLDRYPANGLAGVTAIPVHTGADFTHAMGPTFTLSPLLVELGATVPGRGFYLALSQMDKLDEVVANAAAEYRSNLNRLATVAAATADAPVTA